MAEIVEYERQNRWFLPGLGYLPDPDRFRRTSHLSRYRKKAQPDLRVVINNAALAEGAVKNVNIRRYPGKNRNVNLVSR
jgi:hypothetical protein